MRQWLLRGGRGRLRLAAPSTAIGLGALVVLSLAGSVWLSFLAHQGDIFVNGAEAVVTLVLGAVGVVVARREPRNPVGWILAGTGLAFILCTTGAENYLALDYGSHHGGLPLGALAIILAQCWPLPFLLGPLAILLFPDGRLPSRAWRWLLRAYLVAAALLVADQVTIGLSAIIEMRVRIDSSGRLTSADPRLLANAVSSTATILLVLFILACWLAFVGRQVVSYRRSTGERRQQLKWVMCGAAVSAVSIPAFASGAISNWSVAVFGLVALPLSMGVGILKYRLYEIDRLISRTISYALITGLLVGVYLGVVTVTTRALPLSSPVGVAASTLAAAALFNPLRRRVQRLVDHRFDRARYDADATVAAFAAHLRGAIDLETVQAQLVDAVERTVAPGHASLWIRSR